MKWSILLLALDHQSQRPLFRGAITRSNPNSADQPRRRILRSVVSRHGLRKGGIKKKLVKRRCQKARGRGGPLALAFTQQSGYRGLMRRVLWVAAALAALASAAPAQPGASALNRRLQGLAAGAYQGGAFDNKANTLAQFEEARRLGVDVVEMDLRLSADGVPVVYDDESLAQATFCRKRVRETTLEELRRCDFRQNDEKIPTFEEILGWSQGRVVINVQFKDSETIAPALELVRKHDAYGWVYFKMQGQGEPYEQARRLDGDAAWVFSPKSQQDLDGALSLSDAGLLIIGIEPPLRTPQNIAAIHAKGILVSEDAWHFGRFRENFGAACDEAFEAGIDIAISKDPKGCARQRDALRRRAVASEQSLNPAPSPASEIPAERLRTMLAGLPDVDFDNAVRRASASEGVVAGGLAAAVLLPSGLPAPAPTQAAQSREAVPPPQHTPAEKKTFWWTAGLSHFAWLADLFTTNKVIKGGGYETNPLYTLFGKQNLIGVMASVILVHVGLSFLSWWLYQRSLQYEGEKRRRWQQWAAAVNLGMIISHLFGAVHNAGVLKKMP